ncbi:MAG TPA: YtxH domain-containing protein [Rhabdochlamydiaceae bacterium]|nr:YtxH domain-containing protein [Rhabdochlamydiaceae bacterium]
MRKTQAHHLRDFLLGTVIGGALGALTTSAFTTKKGHKVQKKLAGAYHDFEHVIKSFVKNSVMGKPSRKHKRKRKR